VSIFSKALRIAREEVRDWTEGILRLLPYSLLGNACRNRYWRHRLGIPGPIAVHPGVWFCGVETLSLGKGASINSNVVINACQGRIRIGENVLIGPNVVMRAADHVFVDPDRLIRDQGHESGVIVIEDDCWIGAGAVILKNVTVGRGSVVGAGAVVTRDVPPNSVVAGVPARVIGRRGESKNASGGPLGPC
jgi:acetyltransferase-like isoleucine patch superfamily enzyme